MSAGFVYLFQASTGPVKIGCSKNPGHRLGAFTGLYFDVVLLHVIETDDMHWLEGTLHQQYAAHRIRGEWFTLSEADIAALLAISIRNRPPSIELGYLFLKLPSEYRVALEELASRNRRTLTAEALLALEDHFAKATPPSADDAEPE